MDYPINGPGSNGSGAQAAEAPDVSEAGGGIRDVAQEAVENLGAVVKQGRELILRHPVMSIAGAAAAGYLFARLVARRGR